MLCRRLVSHVLQGGVQQAADAAGLIAVCYRQRTTGCVEQKVKQQSESEIAAAVNAVARALEQARKASVIRCRAGS